MDAYGGSRRTTLFLFSLLLLSSFIYISIASPTLGEDLFDYSSPPAAKSHIPNHKHKVYFTEKGKSVEVRLAYDTDDDEFVSVSVLDRKSNGPFHGSVAILDPNAALLTYAPSASFTGKDTFLSELCRTRDGSKTCSQMQVTVAVRIDIADDQVSTVEGQQVEFMPLDNDDISADPETLLIVTYPLNGAIEANSGVRVVYMPNQGFVGYDSLEYEVCQDESRDNCGRAVANISVNLHTRSDEFEVSSRVASVLDLLKNDGSQAYIDARTLKISTEPKHGTIVSIESGVVTYMPQRNYAGEDSFYYTVCSQELVDSSSLLKTQQTAESAFQQVNVIFERYSEDRAAEQLRQRATTTAATLKEDLPTSMEQVSSWFSASDTIDTMHQEMNTQHATLQEQLLHLKSVELLATWLANHEFYAMRKATASTKAQISDTIGEWDIVIVEVSDGGKDVYGEMEADIEATVSRIFVEDLSYLEAGDLDSAVLAQWLWDNHKEDVERVVQQHSQVVIDKRRVCSEPVKVTLIVQLWAKDDSIRVKEGSTTDVVVLANDHVLAKPATLRLVSLPHAPGAEVDVVQKSTYFVLRYSTPMGFFGQDSFEYQVCTDHTRTICGRARVLAQVEHYAAQAHNDFFQLPYNPKAQRICPLDNDKHVDRRSLSVERESAKGALLELEQDEQGDNTGCVLYTAREASGDDHFHYEVCGTGRGCVKAKVRLNVACSYFGQNPALVDYLLMRRVNEELIDKVNETVALLKRLKTLSRGFDPRANTELAEHIKEWNQALMAFSKEDLANMELLQDYVLGRLLAITPNPSCGTA